MPDGITDFGTMQAQRRMQGSAELSQLLEQQQRMRDIKQRNLSDEWGPLYKSATEALEDTETWKDPGNVVRMQAQRRRAALMLWPRMNLIDMPDPRNDALVTLLARQQQQLNQGIGNPDLYYEDAASKFGEEYLAEFTSRLHNGTVAASAMAGGVETQPGAIAPAGAKPTQPNRGPGRTGQVNELAVGTEERPVLGGVGPPVMDWAASAEPGLGAPTVPQPGMGMVAPPEIYPMTAQPKEAAPEAAVSPDQVAPPELSAMGGVPGTISPTGTVPSPRGLYTGMLNQFYRTPQQRYQSFLQTVNAYGQAVSDPNMPEEMIPRFELWGERLKQQALQYGDPGVLDLITNLQYTGKTGRQWQVARERALGSVLMNTDLIINKPKVLQSKDFVGLSIGQIYEVLALRALETTYAKAGLAAPTVKEVSFIQNRARDIEAQDLSLRTAARQERNAQIQMYLDLKREKRLDDAEAFRQQIDLSQLEISEYNTGLRTAEFEWRKKGGAKAGAIKSGDIVQAVEGGANTVVIGGPKSIVEHFSTRKGVPPDVMADALRMMMDSPPRAWVEHLVSRGLLPKGNRDAANTRWNQDIEAMLHKLIVTAGQVAKDVDVETGGGPDPWDKFDASNPTGTPISSNRGNVQ